MKTHKQIPSDVQLQEMFGEEKVRKKESNNLFVDEMFGEEKVRRGGEVLYHWYQHWYM